MFLHIWTLYFQFCLQCKVEYKITVLSFVGGKCNGNLIINEQFFKALCGEKSITHDEVQKKLEHSIMFVDFNGSHIAFEAFAPDHMIDLYRELVELDLESDNTTYGKNVINFIETIKHIDLADCYHDSIGKK